MKSTKNIFFCLTLLSISMINSDLYSAATVSIDPLERRDKCAEKTAVTTQAKSAAEQNELNSNLMEAIDNCDFEKAKKYIDLGADVNAVNRNGRCPLMEAVSSFFAIVPEFSETMDKIVKLLIEERANVNIVDCNDHSALIKSILTGSETILKLLLDAGADVNYMMPGGTFKAIDYANKFRPETNMPEMLIAAERKQNALHRRNKIIQHLKEITLAVPDIITLINSYLPTDMVDYDDSIKK